MQVKSIKEISDNQELFPAHILPASDSFSVQSVAEHCIQTGNLASTILNPVHLGKTGMLIGTLHDMGKLSNQFKEYIINAASGIPVKRGSVNHTFAGVRWILNRYHHEKPEEFLAAELIGYAIGAHHGLFDCQNENHENGFEHRLIPLKESETVEKRVPTFLMETEKLDQLTAESIKELTNWFEHLNNYSEEWPRNEESISEVCFYVGALSRLLVSALIDADRTDTVCFMDHNPFSEKLQSIDRKQIWKRASDEIEKRIALFSNNSELQKMRSVISNKCLQKAKEKGRIYRLAVPTGGGKTITSLRYAINHCLYTNKSRIIFVMPLLAIIEQNAAVIREYLGDSVEVLEHHSNAVQTDDLQELDEKELLCERWNAPVIVTTLVQLLQTFFSGKTRSIRRFQALVNSVIVIDEVQTVPIKMLSMFNSMINFLSEFCDATVVLCSATQPELSALPQPMRDVQNMLEEDLLTNPVFHRTDIIPEEESLSLESVPEWLLSQMEGIQSLLMICNTKNEAKDIYCGLQEKDILVYHISAGMCTSHRKSVLKKIIGSVKSKEKFICVSTQVMQAGIDLSFDRVIRVSAGIDSIIQAAGRCNRNAESNVPSIVKVVRINGEKLKGLPDIAIEQNAMEWLIAKIKSQDDHDENGLNSSYAIQAYYKHLYSSISRETKYWIKDFDRYMYDLLALNLEWASEYDMHNYTLHQAFKTAGDHFEVFDQDGIDVIVPYDEGLKLIEELKDAERNKNLETAKSLLKKAGNYTVTLFPGIWKKIEQDGGIHNIEMFGINYIDTPFYDSSFGINIPDGNEIKEGFWG